MGGHTHNKSEALTNQKRSFLSWTNSTELSAGQKTDYSLKGKPNLYCPHTHTNISVDIGQTLPCSQGQVCRIHDKAHS